MTAVFNSDFFFEAFPSISKVWESFTDHSFDCIILYISFPSMGKCYFMESRKYLELHITGQRAYVERETIFSCDRSANFPKRWGWYGTFRKQWSSLKRLISPKMQRHQTAANSNEAQMTAISSLGARMVLCFELLWLPDQANDSLRLFHVSFTLRRIWIGSIFL